MTGASILNPEPIDPGTLVRIAGLLQIPAHALMVEDNELVENSRGVQRYRTTWEWE